MRARDRQAIQELNDAHFRAWLERMSRYAVQAQNGPWIPWLRPGQSYASLRRTAARLRSGAFRSADPRLPSSLLAEMIERAIEKDFELAACLKDIREQRELEQALEEKYAAERRRSFVAGFHRLKKSAEAQDPESPAFARVRRIHRARRGESRRRSR